MFAAAPLPAHALASLRRWRVELMVLVCLLVVAGCSPTFNWRVLRPAGTPLEALMPCKPDVAERTLPLDGTPTVLHMHSCEAGGKTFAVAWAELADDTRVPATLAAWRTGALAALRVDASQAADPSLNWTVAVPGALHLQGTQAAGLGPKGQPIQTKSAHFARGRQVFHAAVYGSELPEPVVSTFFEGLKLP